MTAGDAPPGFELVPTRRLLAASFDLLGRSSVDMRRASFYIGVLVLGTVGPIALIQWGIAVAAADRSPDILEAALAGGVGIAQGLASLLAFIGVFVTFVESRALAVALLGGRLSGAPITPRQALARSRRVFWRVVIAGFITGLILSIAQGIVTAIIAALIDLDQEVSVAVSTLAGAVIGAPFAYVLAGIVLGDVDPMEAIRRSFRVFRARRMAAAFVVVIEALAFLLIFLAASAGLDIAVRLLDALGLGTDSGPAGLLLITIGIVALVFAGGRCCSRSWPSRSRRRP